MSRTEELVPQSDAYIEIIKEKLESLSSFRSAIRAIVDVIGSVDKSCVGAINDSKYKIVWVDLKFMVKQCVSGLEKYWQEKSGGSESKMGSIASVVAWDLRHMVNYTRSTGKIPKEALNFESDEGWPLHIVFEPYVAELTPIYSSIKEGGLKKASYSYGKCAQSQTNPSIGAAFTGFTIHFDRNTEGVFHFNSIPLGCLLEIIRFLVNSKHLGQGTGSIYVATICYSYYEIICSLAKYSEAERKVAGISDDKTKNFTGLYETIGETGVTWLSIIEKAKNLSYGVCKNHYNTITKKRATDIIDTVNLPEDKNQLVNMLKEVVGAVGVDSGMLSKIPGLSAITDIIDSLGGKS